MWSRSELKTHAKKVLNLNYWRIVLVALIMVFLTGSGSSGGNVSFQVTLPSSFNENSFRRSSSFDINTIAAIFAAFAVVFIIIFIVSLLLSIFVFNPLAAGGQRFFIKSLREPARIGEITYAFSHSYLNIVKTLFLQHLYISLWSLLFIIPGIIKAYEYKMIPYILAETPEMETKEVFARSKAMMSGDKWNTFVLELSFIGWQILGAFTCSILNIFYVNPYIYLTLAELYAVLKQKVDGPYSRQDNNWEYHSFEQPQQNPYTIY